VLGLAGALPWFLLSDRVPELENAVGSEFREIEL
jgi:hypothetical protein